MTDELTEPFVTLTHPPDKLGAVRTEVGHFDAAGNSADTLDEADTWAEARYGPAGELLLSRQGTGKWTPMGSAVKYPNDPPAR